jgi:hypothetical protein
MLGFLVEVCLSPPQVSTIYSYGDAGNGVAAQVVSHARETLAKLANVLGKRGNDRRRAGTGNRWRQASTGRKTPLTTPTQTYTTGHFEHLKCVGPLEMP